MNPLPVSTKRLADCTIRLGDASLTNCAVMPLFDARGVTAKVAMLSARTRECWVIDWRPGLVYVPLLGAVRVDASRATSQRVASDVSLWLFDPRGLIDLGIASLCGCVPAGNAAAVLPKTVTTLTWRRDLSGIANVWIKKGKGSGDQLGRWKPDWLADATPQPAATANPPPAAARQLQEASPTQAVSGWVLDPIWIR